MAFLSPERSKLLVYGYMRTNFDLETRNCPDDIMQLCHEWYWIEKDFWDLNRCDKKCEVIGDVATYTNKKSFFDHGTVLGTQLISKATDIKEWKIKGISHGSWSKFTFVIGILPSDYDVAENGDDNPFLSCGYGIDVWNGDISLRDADFKGLDHGLYELNKMDIITLKYVSIMSDGDNKQLHGELYFGINDNELIKIHDNIKIDDNQTYILAVSLFASEERIELLQ